MNLRTRAKDAIAGPLDLLSYTSKAYVDLKSQAIEMASALIRFTEEPSTPADLALLEALAVLLPVAVPESQHERVGGDHDGGYVMLQAPAPRSRCPSAWALTCRGTPTWVSGVPGHTCSTTRCASCRRRCPTARSIISEWVLRRRGPC